jgi:uncharacterized protein involved in outer membrane biogenesis
MISAKTVRGVLVAATCLCAASSYAQLPKVMPGMTGTLNIPTLDLSEGAGAPTAPRDGRLFSDAPLKWDALSAAPSDVTFKIGRAELGNGVALTDITLPVKMGGGKLVANNVTANLLGGKLSADVTLTQAGQRASLKLTARNLSLERLAKELGYADGVSRGPVDLNINITGAGPTARAIAASANGSALITMGDAHVRNDVLSAMGADVLVQILNTVGGSAPDTVARCAVVNVALNNGIATTDRGIALMTDKMDAVATGQVNLAQETIDLSVSPRAQQGFAANLGDLSQSLKVVGPLQKPNVAINADSVLNALSNLGRAQAAPQPAGDLCADARNWNRK